MKPIPEKLRKNGFDYTLVHREGKIAIYKREYNRCPRGYEIFKVKIRPAGEYNGKAIPERECFPSNSDFGNNAFSCRTLEDAMACFKRLGEMEKLKK